jgi:prepilin-type N-terminal cleavage/methylation domain-containing protein
MTTNNKRKICLHRRSSRSRGFTLVEMVTVVAVIFIVGAMALPHLQPLLVAQEANTAMDQVLDHLRYARETAIAQRRNVQVQFLGTNVMQLTRYEYNGSTTLLITLLLQNPIQYTTFPSLPDTPDGFGNANPIYFEGVATGPPVMLFQSDGTFVDSAGNLVNGTVFLGFPGNSGTARAVTILGATGRIRAYHASGSMWVQ